MASNLVRMRYWVLSAALGAAVLAGLAGFAQTHKVSKPEQVVRAVGVYEWTGDLAKPKASRFIPVSVFIEGEFRDAGVYVPRPVPFALETGNIYELQDAGVPKGTVELAYARHVQATDSSGEPLFNDGWIGYGSYHAPALTASAALRPSKTPPVITTSGGDGSKPHLTDKSADKSDSGAKAGTDDPDRPTMKRRDSSDDSGANSPSAKSGGNPADDPDRPTMKRRADDDTTTTASSGGSSKDDDVDRPTLKRHSPEEMKKAQKERDSASVSGTGKSLNDDPDRPTLHHQQTSKERELSELSGIPAEMHQMVAVSDAKRRDTHPFVRPWADDTERGMVLEKMRAFARAQLAAYKTPPEGSVMVASGGASAPAANSAQTESVGAATAKAEQDPGAPTLKRGVPQQREELAAAPAPASTKTTTAKTSAGAANVRMKRPVKQTALAPAPLELLDEDLRGYTLSYGGAPTFVYSAHTGGTGSALRYVTVVVQDNGVGGSVSASGEGGLGELKLALANVTDEAHLDRTPRMRLVDVVDAEASNRASLLFELRATRSRQFALYRVIAARPEQIFATGTTE